MGDADWMKKGPESLESVLAEKDALRAKYEEMQKEENERQIDTAFLEGVKAGIAEVRRVLDKCNEPCPTCYENLEAIDPATVKPKATGNMVTHVTLDPRYKVCVQLHPPQKKGYFIVETTQTRDGMRDRICDGRWETARELIEAIAITAPVTDTGSVNRPPVHPTSDKENNDA